MVTNEIEVLQKKGKLAKMTKLLALFQDPGFETPICFVWYFDEILKKPNTDKPQKTSQNFTNNSLCYPN